MCADTKIQFSSLSNYRNGNSEPKITTLYTIADYLGVSADYLIGKSDAESPDIKVQAIHKKTGLSNKAIDVLVGIQELRTSEGEAYVYANHAAYISKLISSVQFSEVVSFIMSYCESVARCKSMMVLEPELTTKFTEGDKIWHDYWKEKQEIQPLSLWRTNDTLTELVKELGETGETK